ncbi:ABC transporter ATP-binding protein [Atopococcus tabaci]|uniref:ABC transporter ATP-binding protein n=1 Tax=Atopococcus tabaci TaxID=269774 RepID=UPI0030C75EAC
MAAIDAFAGVDAGSGELVSRIINDTSIVQQVITSYFPQFVSGLLTIIGVVTILLMMDWRMTVLMLLTVPLMFAVLFPLGKRMGRIARKTQDETAEFNGSIQQTLSEIRLMKSSTAEQTAAEMGGEGIDRLYGLGLKEAKIFALVGPLMYVIITLVVLVVFGYGGLRVANGTLSIGSLVAFLMFLFQLMSPLITFTSFFTQLQRAAGATNRITEIVQLKEEAGQEGIEMDISGLPMTFPDVHFSYGEEPVLENISFTAHPGQKIAFAGPSGGGKTTLFSLIERFYEPETGSIIIGDTPIQELSMSSWRGQIGYVSQENAMMAGTIRENLCDGMEEEAVSDERLWEVAEMAYADGFIKELPDGLDTKVGERGTKLSGGQRQRINIARAFLRNPKILMLDEATASLDSQSEQVVQEALNRLMAGRTTFVIAHRLSTIVDADLILFIEKGHITGKGTHEELAQTHPLYQMFAEQQLT